MIFLYHRYEVLATPERPEGHVYRPILPLEVTGPAGRQVVLALVDTGTDVTILPTFVLALIGATEVGGEQAQFRGVGGQLVTARCASVERSLARGQTRYRWSATVGFLAGRDVAILGHAGFLDYFAGEKHQLHLEPNGLFPRKGKGAR